MPKLEEFPATLAKLRTIIQLLIGGLLVYFAVNSFLAIGFSAALPVVWLLQTIALLMFLPGIRRGTVRSYAWLSFVILLYFTHGVLLLFDAQRLFLGIVEVTLCVLLFTCLVLFIRNYREHFKTGV